MQMFHQHESLARGLADREQAVIVHDHRAVLAEVAVDALALAEILGDAFIGVIADALVEADRLLRHHAQAALQAGDCHADSVCTCIAQFTSGPRASARHRAA